MQKTELKGVYYWAKKLDTHAHITDDTSTNVGGGVLCGKFGALLGSNYADYVPEVCPECVSKFNARKKSKLS